MNYQEVMMAAFNDELQKQAKLGYGLAALAGGGVMVGAGKTADMYRLAKKEQSEQNDERLAKRLQALQAKAQLRKQYGSAFSGS